MNRGWAVPALAAAAAAVAMSVGIVFAPTSSARECPPGFIENPYNSQCLAPVSTPTINGVPCVPSNLGLCSSFVQNQQPPRVPKSSVG